MDNMIILVIGILQISSKLPKYLWLSAIDKKYYSELYFHSVPLNIWCQFNTTE